MLGYTVVGGLLAGIYGIGHDQITYTISPEYFTNLKFDQFYYADLGFSDRGFVAEIGFLATWWVGFFAAWFIARMTVPAFSRAEAFRLALRSFGIVLAVAVAGAVAGWLLGVLHDSDYSKWEPLTSLLQVSDVRSFVCVAYIHNAGYLGGLAGLIASLFAIWRRKQALIPKARGAEGDHW